MQFSIDVEKRAAPPGLERIDVINAFANSISQPPYKVNLDDPEKTILANVIKGSCGVSVVRRYRQLHKLNMLSLTLSGADDKKERDDKKDEKYKDDDKNANTDDEKEEEKGGDTP
jgi:tRNA acetyltransferase TAN1